MLLLVGNDHLKMKNQNTTPSYALIQVPVGMVDSRFDWLRTAVFRINSFIN